MPNRKLPPQTKRSEPVSTMLRKVEKQALEAMQARTGQTFSDIVRDIVLRDPEFRQALQKTQRARRKAA